MHPLVWISSRTRSSALVLAASMLLFSGCDCGGPTGSPCTTRDDCTSEEQCRDGMCVLTSTIDSGTGGRDSGTRADANAPTVTAIRIEPATADLVSVDGSMPEQDFAVIATYSDGIERPAIGPHFTIDPVVLGAIDPASGAFVANGIIGGASTVTAMVGAETATAALTVRLERTLTLPGVPVDVADRFATLVTDEPRSARLVYPLDHAVMPQNVYPADMQWLNGVSGDFFRISMVKPSARITVYLAHDGTLRNHWLAEESAWRSIAESDPDVDAQLTVDRFEASSGQAIAGTPVNVRFARAALTGSVYYWDIAAGRIFRIDDGTAVRNAFMPTPPVANNGSESCVGCHAVSPSGRYMAGRLGGGENIGAVFDLTEDLTTAVPPTMYPLVRGNLAYINATSLRWWFASWSPDETRMIGTFHEDGAAVYTMSGGPAVPYRYLVLLDPFAGTMLPYSGELPASNATHPAWSPDGTQIAYVSDANDFGGENTSGNISMIDVTAPDTFAPSRLIHSASSLAGDTPGGNCDSYPTWTPDSSRIAFAHGPGSRSDNQTDALYMMNRDGTGVVRLAAASPGVDNFQPRFSPFTQGGYFWLSFLSRRDYGNAETDIGTRGDNRQQIWVTAIRVDTPSGEDASSVPYWLPGQNTESRNISAFWAPRPCRPDGEECSSGSECCGANCQPNEDDVRVCSPPPPDRCRMRNETCTTNADCCDDLVCVGNVCIYPLE